MTNQHHITPPPELAQQWVLEAHSKFAPSGTCPDTRILIARAAQWGADQELKACVEWLANDDDRQALQACRRPKPPSLKEEALDVLHLSFDRGYLKKEAVDTIHRALEQLND